MSLKDIKIKKEYLRRWRKDFDFKTLINARVSLIMTFVFALYNGYLGIRHSSLWYGTICVYYLILSVFRGFVIVSGKKLSGRENQEKSIRKVYIAASVCLIILNISLVVPVSLMARQQKPVNMTLVPAIAMAAYTTYKVISASVNLKRRKKSSNGFVKLLRTINFIDALVSILTLQNTLIMTVSDGASPDMMPLVSMTSGAIMLVILALSVTVLIKGIRGRSFSHKEPSPVRPPVRPVRYE